MMLLGLFGGPDSTTASLIGVGAVAVFFGVALLARGSCGRSPRVVGRPLERLRGLTGRLARENATRNPAGPPSPRRR